MRSGPSRRIHGRAPEDLPERLRLAQEPQGARARRQAWHRGAQSLPLFTPAHRLLGSMLRMRHETKTASSPRCTQAIGEGHFDTIEIVPGKAQVAARERSVSALSSAIASTGAGSVTRASRSRSTQSKCATVRAGAPRENGTTVDGIPRCAQIVLVGQRERTRTAPSRAPAASLRDPVRDAAAEAQGLDVEHRARAIRAFR